MIDKVRKALTGKRSRVILILSFTFFLVKGLAWLALWAYAMYYGYSLFD